MKEKIKQKMHIQIINAYLMKCIQLTYLQVYYFTVYE